MNKQINNIEEISNEKDYCIEEYCPKCLRTKEKCLECMKYRLNTINTLIKEIKRS